MTESDRIADLERRVAKRRSKYTFIYTDYQESKEIHYVRLAPLETLNFPHGIALATTFSTRQSASDFADLVDDYIKQAFEKPIRTDEVTCTGEMK